MFLNHGRFRVRAGSGTVIRAVGATVFLVSVLGTAAGCATASQSQSTQGATTSLGPTTGVPVAATTLTFPSASASTTAPAAPAQTTIAVAKTKLPISPVSGPCLTGNVKVTASGSNGAAGTQVERFLIKNTGSASCTLQSYPGFSIYGPMPQGGSTVEANLPLTVQPIPAGFGDLGGPGGLVTLTPGGTAAFFVKWSDVPTGSSACPTGDGFSFATPTDGAHQTLVTFSFGAVCGTTVYDSQIFPPSVVD